MESLKSSKFEAFKSNQLLNTINVVGGKQYCTTSRGASDCWDDSTGKDIKCTDGSTYDKCALAAIAHDVTLEDGSEDVTTFLNPNSPC